MGGALLRKVRLVTRLWLASSAYARMLARFVDVLMHSCFRDASVHGFARTQPHTAHTIDAFQFSRARERLVSPHGLRAKTWTNCRTAPARPAFQRAIRRGVEAPWRDSMLGHHFPAPGAVPSPAVSEMLPED